MRNSPNHITPPRWPLKLLDFFLKKDYLEEIEGDMEEVFQDNLSQYSEKKARRTYLLDTLKLLRPALIKKILNTQNSFLNRNGMFKNHFKISIRSLVKQKQFTAINVIGLAIGLSSFLLINEYIKFEKSYDSFHTDADQLYRVSYVEKLNGVDGVRDAMASCMLGEVLEDEIPEVLLNTVTKNIQEMTFRYGNNVFAEKKIISADTNFLKMFSYKVLEGSPETLLSKPQSIVLTQSKANAYFGDENSIGKTLELIAPYKASFIVTGVIEDVPSNTHYSFDMMISDATLGNNPYDKNWHWNNYYVYLKLSKNYEKGSLSNSLKAISKKYITDNEIELDIHPVQDIHLKSDFTYEPQIQGSEKTVDFLMIISIFILIIAWVNYINLSTARSIDRAKEVGMRKVIGAVRKQLVAQFLTESFLINMIGGLVALFIAELFLPFFNQLVGIELIGHVWSHPPFLISLSIFCILGSFVSGFYPALVLSSFKPISVLKGNFRTSKSGIMMRKILVIAQFSVSLFLIAATFIVFNQVNYMQGRDIGISIDKVVSFKIPSSNADTKEAFEAYLNKISSFKENLKTHSVIESVGGTSNLPGGLSSDINSINDKIKILAHTEFMDGTTYVQYNDDGFLDAVDMQLVAGRDFDKSIKSDSAAVMVNESFFKRFGISDVKSMVNEKIQIGQKKNNRYRIVGIVKDFNRTTLKDQVEPTIYYLGRNIRYFIVELSSINYMSGLEFTEKTWNEFFPEIPFDFTFLDQRFASLYEQDQRFGDIFMIFSILAIIIAILGLYGLSSFLAIQRSKEVGVRKVLGATASQIVFLFFRGFLSLIGVSAIISFPIVYLLMNNWLDDYAYRIGFPWIALVVSLGVILTFALITVGYQTSKVASLNPAKTLKGE